MLADLRMQWDLALRHSLCLSFLIAGTAGYLLGNAEDLHSVGPSASQAVALRFPDLSAFQNGALHLLDISTSQNAAPRSVEASKAAVPGRPHLTTAAVFARPAPLLYLIGLQVVPALPPLGHTRFCLRYPDDCKIHGIDFRNRSIELTAERWNELATVNGDVNARIMAADTSGNDATQVWAISPPTGDCKDYAITKRHELLARGWPSRSLLLSEVKLLSGEHHLILVVRVKGGDLVLDNLKHDILLVPSTYDQYRWVRIQSPQNPKFWVSVRNGDASHTAMQSN